MTLPAELTRTALRHCYAAAVHAVEPRRAILAALESQAPPDQPAVILAAGKAALGMATGLVEWLHRHGKVPVDGMIFPTEDSATPHPALRVMVGDHPVPRAASQAASRALGDWILALPPDAAVHVAISGGASALIAGPLPGLTMRDLTQTFEVLLASGIDISQTNAIRKRVACWTAGRLAMALHPRPVTTWLLSDVPGDDPEVIGSGPCHGDRWSARDVMALCRREGLLELLPSSVIAALEFETPKPWHPEANEQTTIVASNRVAMEAARACAVALGYHAKSIAKPLSGDARIAGRQTARALLQLHGSRFDAQDTLGDAHRARVFIYGGETTVVLDAGHGVGGRNLEFALAAAELLADADRHITLLAAGTDGRDGPTDAAGAIVDETTWAAIAAAGIDPAAALAAHDSYRALDAAGALIKTGMSGTNVMDVVIAMHQPHP